MNQEYIGPRREKINDWKGGRSFLKGFYFGGGESRSQRESGNILELTERRSMIERATDPSSSVFILGVEKVDPMDAYFVLL